MFYFTHADIDNSVKCCFKSIMLLNRILCYHTNCVQLQYTALNSIHCKLESLHWLAILLSEKHFVKLTNSTHGCTLTMSFNALSKKWPLLNLLVVSVYTYTAKNEFWIWQCLKTLASTLDCFPFSYRPYCLQLEAFFKRLLPISPYVLLQTMSVVPNHITKPLN